MAGTCNIIGTGGLIEGDLQDANIVINLDDALEFDGTDDEIDIGDVTILDGLGSWTQSVWVKFAAGGANDQYVFWKDDAFGIGLFSGYRIRGYIYYSGGNSNTQYELAGTGTFPRGDNSWHHIAQTYDGSNLKLYFDGVLRDTTAISSKTIPNVSDKLHIGSGDGGNFTKGNIADARLYSSTLDADEIGVLASEINIANEVVEHSTTSTLVGWWKLNNNSITDSSTNSNNGTAAGTTRDYDAYSAGPQAGVFSGYSATTTTDGAFTVTQGNLDCGTISSVDFNGVDQYLGATLTSEQKSTREITVSCWFQADDVTNKGIIGRYNGNGGSAENSIYINGSSQ